MTDTICSQYNGHAIVFTGGDGKSVDTGFCLIDKGIPGLVTDQTGLVPKPATHEEIAAYLEANRLPLKPEDLEGKGTIALLPSRPAQGLTVLDDLTEEGIALTRQLAGTKAGDCRGDGLSFTYASLGSYWKGTRVAWTADAFTALQGFFKQVPAQYCLDENHPMDGTDPQIGFRMTPDNFTAVFGALGTLGQSCGSLDQAHCGMARELLSASFQAYYKAPAPPIEGQPTLEDKLAENESRAHWWMFGIFVGVHIVGHILVRLIDRLFPPKGGGGPAGGAGSTDFEKGFAKGFSYGSNGAQNVTADDVQRVLEGTPLGMTGASLKGFEISPERTPFVSGPIAVPVAAPVLVPAY